LNDSELNGILFSQVCFFRDKIKTGICENGIGY